MSAQRPVCRHYTLELLRGCEAGRIAPMDCPACLAYDPERIGGEMSIAQQQRLNNWRQCEQSSDGQ